MSCLPYRDIVSISPEARAAAKPAPLPAERERATRTHGKLLGWSAGTMAAAALVAIVCAARGFELGVAAAYIVLATATVLMGTRTR